MGETIETTLWRELQEEVGLEAKDFAQITLFPEWTIHQYALVDEDPTKSRLGQAHCWYFLELRSDVTIDLSRAREYEASDWRWATFSEAIAETESVKKPVYETLAAFYEQWITIQMPSIE